MKIFILLFFSLLYCNNFFCFDLNKINNNVEEIDPNGIQSGFNYFFNGTKELLFTQNYVSGINFFLDSISSFFLNTSKRCNLELDKCNEIHELIIKFKYQLTVLMNIYFKSYRYKSNSSEIIGQRQKISESIKLIFTNLLYLIIRPTEIKSTLKNIFSELLKIISVIFSDGKLDQTDLQNAQGALNDVMNTYKLIVEKSQNINLAEYKKMHSTEYSNIAKSISEIFNNLLTINDLSRDQQTEKSFESLLKFSSIVFAE